MTALASIDIQILAGGLATRLRGVLTDRPKILAPVAKRPFLDWLLDWLAEQGARRVVLGLGYRADMVLDYLADNPHPELEIVPVIEPQPLGTAGAVAFARPYFRSDPVMVLNGDTILEADLSEFAAEHRRSPSMGSMICVRLADARRYGSVEIDAAGRVLSFREKGSSTASGWINGGVYLFGGAVIDRIAGLASGSLEREVLAAMPPGSIHAFRTEGRFLDIGTPESLASAEDFLSCWKPALDAEDFLSCWKPALDLQ